MHKDFKEARLRAGLTINQTAALLGINPQSVRRFEMNENRSTARRPPELALRVLDWFARQVPPHLPD